MRPLQELSVRAALSTLLVLSTPASLGDQSTAIGHGASATAKLNFRITIPARLVVTPRNAGSHRVLANAGPLLVAGPAGATRYDGMTHRIEHNPSLDRDTRQAIYMIP